MSALYKYDENGNPIFTDEEREELLLGSDEVTRREFNLLRQNVESLDSEFEQGGRVDLLEKEVALLPTADDVVQVVNSGLSGLFMREKHVFVDAGKMNVAFTADTVAGYEFVGWIQSASTGHVTWSYIEHPNLKSTQLFTSANTAGRSLEYICSALYRRVIS